MTCKNSSSGHSKSSGPLFRPFRTNFPSLCPVNTEVSPTVMLNRAQIRQPHDPISPQTVVNRPTNEPWTHHACDDANANTPEPHAQTCDTERTKVGGRRGDGRLMGNINVRPVSAVSLSGLPTLCQTLSNTDRWSSFNYIISVRIVGKSFDLRSKYNSSILSTDNGHICHYFSLMD